MCDPQEVQVVKDALAANPNNLGIGLVHEPTGHVHLKPFDTVPGGHAQLAGDLRLPLNEVKGFVIGLSGRAYQVLNVSHLNNPAGQGAGGPLQMPQPLFDSVQQALKDAGL